MHVEMFGERPKEIIKGKSKFLNSVLVLRDKQLFICQGHMFDLYMNIILLKINLILFF